MRSFNIFRSHLFNSFLHRLHASNGVPLRYNSKFVNTSLNKMNRLMISFFKQPNMYIRRDNNIIPFRFFTKDKIILNGIQYINNKQSKKWIITTHDFGQNKFWALFFARPFIELGYNILAFDFRNHGDNYDVEPVTLGALETIDLESAINWLVKNKNPDFIGLNGKGLGSFTINNLYYENPELFIKSKIKFAVCESVYTSSESLMQSVFTKKRFVNKKPFISLMTRKIREIVKTAKIEEDVDLTQNNLLNRINNNKEKIAKNYVPFLYTTATVDNSVVAADSYKLIVNRDIFKQRKNHDKIAIYNFSEHGLLFKDHFKKNFREIIDFENKVIGNDESTYRAINRMKLDDASILASGEEENELTTFIFDK